MLVNLLIILGLFLAPQHQTPTIEARNGGEAFTVHYDRGAFMVTVIYHDEFQGEPDANFPDGHYTPRKIYMVSGMSTTLEEDWNWIDPADHDWKVYAEVLYEVPNAKPITLTSNVLEIHR